VLAVYEGDCSRPETSCSIRAVYFSYR
jgi:hypothetical protein